MSEDGIYHDLESVVLYYDKFGHLPSNFITKKEAKDLGWEGGKLDPYVKGGSIGGDHFGNYEKRLPSGKGVKYIECDIDTDGGKRGSKRLIISNDGRYYYTADHYDSFREVVVENGNITFAD
ncbi:MAG: ribonuclease [Lachnospiraceae bacterium]|nr:ribonuclease [Lachnospiraceae bacterium]